jgi:hypothetical protein
MSRVTFDISLQLSVVALERQRLDVGALRGAALRGLGKGLALVTFEPARDYMRLETFVPDWLFQMRGVVRDIDAGKFETFTVDPDYYNNSIRYTYRSQDKSLELYEVNGGDFKIRTPYKEFRRSFRAFLPAALKEVMLFYPELEGNTEFLAMCDE